MFSEEKLKEVVASILGVDASTVGTDTSTDTVVEWDSIRHMNLILALEETFDVSFPDENVIELTSYDLLRIELQELLDA